MAATQLQKTAPEKQKVTIGDASRIPVFRCLLEEHRLKALVSSYVRNYGTGNQHLRTAEATEAIVWWHVSQVRLQPTKAHLCR